MDSVTAVLAADHLAPTLGTEITANSTEYGDFSAPGVSYECRTCHQYREYSCLTSWFLNSSSVPEAPFHMIIRILGLHSMSRAPEQWGRVPIYFDQQNLLQHFDQQVN